MTQIVVFPFCADDAFKVETLIDSIALLHNKQPRGHCLLVAFPDAQKEFQEKLKIAASIAFAKVDLLVLAWPKIPPVGKADSINFLFLETSKAIKERYKTPFVFLESDAVPMCPNWLDQLEDAYDATPMRYMGAILKDSNGRHCLSRVAVYPPDAYDDVKPHISAGGKIPFELAMMEILTERAARTTLIQQLRFESTTDPAKVRPDAVIVHSDKEGVLLLTVREKYVGKVAEKPLTDVFSDAPPAAAPEKPAKGKKEKQFI